MNAFFASPVDFVFLHKDIDVLVGGFISDFSNSHDCTDPGTRHAIAARQHADGNGTGVEAPGRPPRVSTAQTGPPTSVGPFSALVWRLLRKAS